MYCDELKGSGGKNGLSVATMGYHVCGSSSNLPDRWKFSFFFEEVNA
jgi:hypothetical protein